MDSDRRAPPGAAVTGPSHREALQHTDRLPQAPGKSLLGRARPFPRLRPSWLNATSTGPPGAASPTQGGPASPSASSPGAAQSRHALAFGNDVEGPTNRRSRWACRSLRKAFGRECAGARAGGPGPPRHVARQPPSPPGLDSALDPGASWRSTRARKRLGSMGSPERAGPC